MNKFHLYLYKDNRPLEKLQQFVLASLITL